MSGKVLSDHAFQIVELAARLDVKMWSDPNWSLLEAVEMETPAGLVHLHWKNHRGRGHWNLVTQRFGNGEICKTARCRVVTIIPHGGENEAADISRQRYDAAVSNWMATKNVENMQKIDVQNAIYAEREKQRRIAEELMRREWPLAEQRQWELYQQRRMKEQREQREREWPSAEGDIYRGRRYLKRIAELDVPS